MTHCRHHACQCARAAELAEMGLLPEALEVHQDDQEVLCREEEARGDLNCTCQENIQTCPVRWLQEQGANVLR